MSSDHTSPAPALSTWLDAKAAARILVDSSARNVMALAAKGLITTRSLPGVRARYLRADVERLAREMVTPATR